MRRVPRVWVAAAAGLLLVAPPAAAAGPQQERERVRDRRTTLTGELGSIEATDAELTRALADLDQRVAGQVRTTNRAEQAFAAAEADLEDARNELEANRLQVTALTDRVVGRAVDSFMAPSQPSIRDVVESEDLGEAARKDALLGRVAARDDALVDELRAAEDLLEVQEAEADRAVVEAEARRRAAEEALAGLEATRRERRTVQEQLGRRRREVRREIDSLEAADAELTSIIRRAEARRAAELARIEAQRQEAARQAAASAAAAAQSAAASADVPAASVAAPPPSGGPCSWPTTGRVTSEYGYRWGRLHAGIDIAAPTGTPITASLAGTVLFAGVQSGYGNVVIVGHGGGLSTVYAHQSRLGSSVGQSVGTGEVIGYVGNTGNSTGPHLHFETRYDGVARNPRGCL